MLSIPLRISRLPSRVRLTGQRYSYHLSRYSSSTSEEYLEDVSRRSSSGLNTKSFNKAQPAPEDRPRRCFLPDRGPNEMSGLSDG